MKIKINLIPLAKKEAIAKNKKLKLVIKLEIIISLALIAFFIVLMSFQYISNLNLNVYLSGQKKNKNLTQYNKINQYDINFKQANLKIKNVIAIEKQQLYWSKMFTQLSAIIFPGITIDDLSTENFKVTIQGKADTRDELIVFKNKLDKNNCFSDVNLPLSNLVNRSNINFKISFQTKKSCLSNK